VDQGRIVFSGWIKGYGLVIIMDHGERYYTLLAHLDEARVKVGQRVVAGQELGLSGRAGLARSGVYFEIRHQDQALDPVSWLAGGSS
jgi:septal ring factor EnvC (AmiA/AmiB activator)